jgi:16S rRNA (guanine527-N7)-methyltransferase
MIKYKLGDNMIREFYDRLEQLQISLSDSQKNQFLVYFEQLSEWNQKMNLTGITDEYGVYMKHFLDSIYLSQVIQLDKMSLLDVGSGAGFPSIPLKIIFPSLQVTIIDSLSKRITFLSHLVRSLGMDVELIHGRAEEYQKKNYYDIVTARAVANLSMLSELCLPFVKMGGMFLAMKGPKYQQEIAESSNALHILGGKVNTVYQYEILEESHNIILIEKIKITGNAYPRKFNKIKSKPL